MKYFTPPLLDTHIWVWWAAGIGPLTKRERTFLDDLPRGKRPFVCDISLWEVATLVSRNRIDLGSSLLDWFFRAAHPETVQLISLNPSIAYEVASLPESFHRDPADRIIAATARNLNLPLWTQDKRIRKSKIVEIWSHV